MNDSIDEKDGIKKNSNNSLHSESKENTVDVDGLSKKLQKSDDTISTLRLEVSNLKAVIDKLNTENYELRTRLSQTGTNSMNSFNGDSGCSSLDVLLVRIRVYLIIKNILPLYRYHVYDFHFFLESRTTTRKWTATRFS